MNKLIALLLFTAVSLCDKEKCTVVIMVYMTAHLKHCKLLNSAP